MSIIRYVVATPDGQIVCMANSFPINRTKLEAEKARKCYEQMSGIKSFVIVKLEGTL